MFKYRLRQLFEKVPASKVDIAFILQLDDHDWLSLLRASEIYFAIYYKEYTKLESAKSNGRYDFFFFEIYYTASNGMRSNVFLGTKVESGQVIELMDDAENENQSYARRLEWNKNPHTFLTFIFDIFKNKNGNLKLDNRYPFSVLLSDPIDCQFHLQDAWQIILENKSESHTLFETPQMLCKAVYLEPHERLAPEIHPDTTQFFHVVSGSGTAKLDGREDKIKANSMFYAGPGMRHEIVASEDGLCMYTIYAPAKHTTVRLGEQFCAHCCGETSGALKCDKCDTVYCGDNCAEEHFDTHKVLCGRRMVPRAERKVHKVMREFKEGRLHSGSKIVTNRKQAVAIALNEARRKGV